MSAPPQTKPVSDTVRLRIRSNTPGIEMGTTKNLKKAMTVKEAVDFIKQIALPTLMLPVEFHLFSSDGLPFNDSGTLESYGLADGEEVLLKPKDPKAVQERLNLKTERKLPSSSSQIMQQAVKSGFLLKKKTPARKFSYQRRFCVLKDNCLFVFKSPKDAEPKKQFDLERCKLVFGDVATCFKNASAKEELFRIEMSPKKSWSFTAETESEAQSWYTGIAARKASNSSSFDELLRGASVTGYVSKKTKVGPLSGGIVSRKYALLNGTDLYLMDSPADESAKEFQLYSTKIVLSDTRKDITVTQMGEEPFILTPEQASDYMEWARALRLALSTASVVSDEGAEEAHEDMKTGYIKAGYMLKKKVTRRLSSYKKRWFILKGNRLYYMHSSSDKTPLGSFDLLHTQSNLYLLDEDQKKSAGHIELVTIGAIYIIQHPDNDEAELASWCEAIKQQSFGVPFNVVHKSHVDFNYNWTGENPDTMFEFLDMIGEGAYATVHRAKHRDTGVEIAIKILKSVDDVMLASLQKEIDVLKTCRSPNIVSYYGTLPRKDQLWILTEFCACGSVKDLIKVTRETLNEDQLSYVCTETLKGLVYLHAINIIHHDIKAGNILLNEDAQVKLADFGVSQQFKDMGDIQADDFIGSPLYMSPEVVKKSKYNNKTDIWSLGITLIEMAEGSPPNTHVTSFEMLQKLQESGMKTLSSPGMWSPGFKDVVAKCLTYDMDKRPDTLELLTHPFIRSMKSRECMKPLVALYLGAKEKAKKEQAQAKKLVV